MVERTAAHAEVEPAAAAAAAAAAAGDERDSPQRIPRDVDAANRWRAYTSGWRVGARGGVPDRNATGHANEGIRGAYTAGYEAGLRAFNEAAHAASERYGYTPSPLRIGGPGRLRRRPTPNPSTNWQLDVEQILPAANTRTVGNIGDHGQFNELVAYCDFKVTIDSTYPTLPLTNWTASTVPAWSFVIVYSDQSPARSSAPLMKPEPTAVTLFSELHAAHTASSAWPVVTAPAQLPVSCVAFEPSNVTAPPAGSAIANSSPISFLLLVQVLPLQFTVTVVSAASGVIATNVAERCVELVEAVIGPSCANVHPDAETDTAVGTSEALHDTWSTTALLAACARAGNESLAPAPELFCTNGAT